MALAGKSVLFGGFLEKKKLKAGAEGSVAPRGEVDTGAQAPPPLTELESAF